MMDNHSPLQGGLGYLLIAEIVIVTGLVFALIALILKRIRFPQEALPLPAPLETSSQAVMDVTKSPEYLELLAKLQSIEGEKAQALVNTVSSEEVGPLKEKLAYLENKLLEYEIVQEEIGALGELKAENEKLKAELVGLKNAQVNSQTDNLIKEQFKEFAEPVAEVKQPLPGELENLLSDIDSLGQGKEPEKKP